MTSAHGYQSKVAEIERLARDPCLPPELRMGFGSSRANGVIARHSRTGPSVN
jgi:hypothetical protein